MSKRKPSRYSPEELSEQKLRRKIARTDRIVWTLNHTNFKPLVGIVLFVAFIWLGIALSNAKDDCAMLSEALDELYEENLELKGEIEDYKYELNKEYETIASLEAELRECQLELEDARSEYYDLDDETSGRISYLEDELRIARGRYEEEVVNVWVCPTGTKYHSYYCQYTSSTSISMTREEALRKGYSPCEVCNPDKD